MLRRGGLRFLLCVALVVGVLLIPFTANAQDEFPESVEPYEVRVLGVDGRPSVYALDGDGKGTVENGNQAIVPVATSSDEGMDDGGAPLQAQTEPACALALGEWTDVALGEGEAFVASFTAPEDGRYAFVSADDVYAFAEAFADADLTQYVYWQEDECWDGFSITHEMSIGETVYLSVRTHDGATCTFSVSAKLLRATTGALELGEELHVETQDGGYLLGQLSIPGPGEYVLRASGPSTVELYEDEDLALGCNCSGRSLYRAGDVQTSYHRFSLSAGGTYWVRAYEDAFSAAALDICARTVSAATGADLTLDEALQVETHEGECFVSGLSVPEDGEYVIWTSGGGFSDVELFRDEAMTSTVWPTLRRYGNGMYEHHYILDAQEDYRLRACGEGYGFEGASFALGLRKAVEPVEVTSSITLGEATHAEVGDGEFFVGRLEVPQAGRHIVWVSGFDDGFLDVNLYADDALADLCPCEMPLTFEEGMQSYLWQLEAGTYWVAVRNMSSEGLRAASFDVGARSSEVSRADLEVGAQLSVKLEDGDSFLGTFTAPADGTYAITCPSTYETRNVHGALYADEGLSQPLTVDADWDWWSDFTFVRNMRAGEAIYLSASAYTGGGFGFPVLVKRLDASPVELVPGETVSLDARDGGCFVGSVEVPESGDYVVSVTGSPQAVVMLYEDEGMTGESRCWPISSNKYGSGGRQDYRYGLEAGRTYWVRAYGFGFGATTFDVGFRQTAIIRDALELGRQSEATCGYADTYVGSFTAVVSGTYTFSVSGGYWETYGLYADEGLTSLLANADGQGPDYSIAREMCAGETVYLSSCRRYAGGLSVLVSSDDAPDLSRDGWVDLSGGAKGYARGGALVTGWMDLGSSKFYFQPDGAMSVGWTDVVVDGKQMHYYFNPASGNLVRGTWFEIDGRKYYFRPSGNLATGWATIADNGVDKKYYFEDDGTLVAGCWRDIDTGQGYAGHYYFRPSGNMATGWATIDNQKYWFRPSGNMATGWADVDDAYKRYFDADGIMLTGWREIGGKTYYFRPSGAMQTGTATIDGEPHTFSDKGVLIS